MVMEVKIKNEKIYIYTEGLPTCYIHKYGLPVARVGNITHYTKCKRNEIEIQLTILGHVIGWLNRNSLTILHIALYILPYIVFYIIYRG